MRVLNINITDNQDEWLLKHSDTVSMARKGLGKTKSQHVRDALEMYIKSREENN